MQAFDRRLWMVLVVIGLVLAGLSFGSPIAAQDATPAPTEEAMEEPTAAPTEEPMEEPTAAPTEEPMEEPTAVPTEEPMEEPTAAPTEEPLPEPDEQPVPGGGDNTATIFFVLGLVVLFAGAYIFYTRRQAAA